MEEKMKFLEGRVKCRSIVECIMCGVFITGLTASSVFLPKIVAFFRIYLTYSRQ